MTDEEIAEYNRLRARYNHLVAENNRLAVELETGIQNCHVVASNIDTVGDQVTKDVRYVSNETSAADEIVVKLLYSLEELTKQYFLYKNLSEASKMLTKYNDEYYTKFQFYNELRRITLGYVIGIDAHIVSHEGLRKKVEKTYLANTDYWLAYAIMAVMLWVSDEQEAAQRALSRALTMDCYRSCVFFMLVNVRFGRMDTAKNWFITLLDKTDVNNMGDEWQHVLRVYLDGGLTSQKDFDQIVKDCFVKMVEQTEATSVDYSTTVVQRANQYAKSYIHVSNTQHLILKECCAEYPEMHYTLSAMEKIRILATHFDEVFQKEADKADNMFERIENVLYDLINAYEENEYVVIKEIRKNEAILAAEGDKKLANERYLQMYGEDEKPMRFGDLLTRWAFDDDARRTDIVVRRFAISYLKDRIAQGVISFFEQAYAEQHQQFTVTIYTTQKIDPVKLVCNENDQESAEKQVRDHYTKNKTKFVFADTFFKVGLVCCVVALILFAVAALVVAVAATTALSIGSLTVSLVPLLLGIALAAVGVTLLIKRWIDVGKEVKEHTRLGLIKLHKAFEEMHAWRQALQTEYAALEDLSAAINRF